MKNTINISDIEFDGAKILKAERSGENISITVKPPGKVEGLEVSFISVSDEKAAFYKGEGKVTVNTCFPPLDVIETFEVKNGVYQFSGYLNHEPWSVWKFKAFNYVISSI